ncbi:glycosyltransferase family 4 protein [Novosphingobium resinovorum]|uniref:glycosyltransferase family 4 protein n=1 Tax=Novosphingobium resinovorum TaxID=158500 RepID=UPI002ED29527|nr:glycosyltransferase family 4 protein [Novosphingobium resinovorum]
MKRVSYIFPTSHHYRKPFHEKLRLLLAERNVDYRVVYCDPKAENIKKNDTVDIDWGVKVGTKTLPFGLEYQCGFREALKSDMVIVQQENKLVLNYMLNILSMLGAKRLAYFGHGRNFQSRNPSGLSERWKRLWATKVNWWFGYTEETRRHVVSLGFPSDNITVFNNSVDTSQLRGQVERITPERLQVLRAELGLAGRNVGVFVGGIYPDKRMAFLIEACERIRSRIPDFELLVVGGGADLPVIEALAKSRPWVRVLGPRFGVEKVELMMLGHVFMMPGLMGLAILDAAVVGLPIATTRYPWHSPEIAYLDVDRNGVMVDEWENSQAYADAVSGILVDAAVQQSMAAEARAMADRYSIERMAENFAAGVLRALDA